MTNRLGLVEADFVPHSCRSLLTSSSPTVHSVQKAVQCTYPATSDLREGQGTSGLCWLGQSYSNHQPTECSARPAIHCPYSSYTHTSQTSPVGRLFFSIYWHRYFYDIQTQAERIKKSIRFFPLPTASLTARRLEGSALIPDNCTAPTAFSLLPICSLISVKLGEPCLNACQPCQWPSWVLSCFC